MICSLLAGSALAERTERRFRLLGQALSFVQHAYADVSYSQLPPDRILQGFSCPEGSFFARCRELNAAGEDVASAWRLAIDGSVDVKALLPEELEALSALGRELGRLDKLGQLASLERSREYFARALEESRAEKHTRTKLCMSSAASVGAIAAILIL